MPQYKLFCSITQPLADMPNWHKTGAYLTHEILPNAAYRFLFYEADIEFPHPATFAEIYHQNKVCYLWHGPGAIFHGDVLLCADGKAYKCTADTAYLMYAKILAKERYHYGKYNPSDPEIPHLTHTCDSHNLDDIALVPIDDVRRSPLICVLALAHKCDFDGLRFDLHPHSDQLTKIPYDEIPEIAAVRSILRTLDFSSRDTLFTATDSYARLVAALQALNIAHSKLCGFI